jgi:hypothetical protein
MTSATQAGNDATRVSPLDPRQGGRRQVLSPDARLSALDTSRPRGVRTAHRPFDSLTRDQPTEIELAEPLAELLNYGIEHCQRVDRRLHPPTRGTPPPASAADYLPGQSEAEAIEAELKAAVEREALVPAAKAGVELVELGEAPVPQSPVRARTSDGKFFYGARYLDDAVAKQCGGFPIPAPQRRAIRKLIRAGASFPEAWFWHQVAESWSEGLPMEDHLVSTPAHLARADELALAAIQRITTSIRVVTRRTATAPLALTTGLAALLDPVLVGGCVSQANPSMGRWFFIASWTL